MNMFESLCFKDKIECIKFNAREETHRTLILLKFHESWNLYCHFLFCYKIFVSYFASETGTPVHVYGYSIIRVIIVVIAVIDLSNSIDTH